MKAIKLKVKTNNNQYNIVIGSGLIKKLKTIFKNNLINFNKCLIIADKNIHKKIISEIIKQFPKKKISVHYFQANEKNKNQKNINKITNILLKENFSRDDCLLSIGGGITGDMSGFAASIFKRGLKFVNIPTTLLSQVDSSVGGKTGINTNYGKNLIGSFYQPNLVISDTKFLNTLPKREIHCGYAEILKHALISNKNFFNFLDKNLSQILSLKTPIIEKTIFKSCKIKRDVIQKDEKEKEIRKILNFGHTFAHAFEASLNFSKKLNHGEAVILGIKVALKFSLINKNLIKKDYDLILKHLRTSNIPHDIKKHFSRKDVNRIISFMLIDKKNFSNKINLVLLKKIGLPLINQQFGKIYLSTFLKRELSN